MASPLSGVKKTVTDRATFWGLTLGRLRLLLGLCPQPLLLLAQLGRERGAEIVRLEPPANLDLGPAVEGGTLQPLDRLVHRLDLPQPEAGDQLLGLGERPVDHSP